MTEQDRIVRMTRAALYEQKEKNRALYRLRFFKRDYVTFHILMIWMCVTAAFGIAFAVWLLCQTEASGNYSLTQWISFGILAIVIYATLSIVYVLIAWNLYSSRYEEAEASAKKYEEYLTQLKE